VNWFRPDCSRDTFRGPGFFRQQKLTLGTRGGLRCNGLAYLARPLAQLGQECRTARDSPRLTVRIPRVPARICVPFGPVDVGWPGVMKGSPVVRLLPQCPTCE